MKVITKLVRLDREPEGLRVRNDRWLRKRFPIRRRLAFKWNRDRNETYVKIDGEWYKIVFEEMDEEEAKRKAEEYYRKANTEYYLELASDCYTSALGRAREAVEIIGRMKRYANNLGLMEWLVERI